jgi:hypothetical protein
MNSSNDHSPDVATILEQLRAEVRARRLAASSNDESNAARNAIERQLQRCAEQLEITRVVSAHWPLESRSFFQRGVNFINKVVRRLLRWYINPIVEQQNAFNDTTARTLRLLIEGYSELLRQSSEDEQTQEPGAENREQETSDPESDHSSHTVPPSSFNIQQLQALVEEQGRAEPPATLTDVTLRSLPAQLALRQEVNAHWPLTGRTPVERAAAFVHRLMRFYLRWLINPIVEQQNTFNAAVSETIPPLLTADAEVRGQQAARRARAANKDT